MVSKRFGQSQKNSGRLSNSAAVFIRECSGVGDEMDSVQSSQVGRAKVQRCPPNSTFLDGMTGNQNTLPNLFALWLTNWLTKSGGHPTLEGYLEGYWYQEEHHYWINLH